MKSNIILAGVGGQGILSIAATIGTAALAKDLHMKQSEVHGMSQRGGAVVSHLRISDKPIASDLIPYGGAQLILSVEPMEALRYMPFLSPEGWVVTNSKPFVNIEAYPDIDKLKAKIESLPHHVMLDADHIAQDLGNKLAANIVMLGAASPFLGLDYETLEDSIRQIFRHKSQRIIGANLKALAKGREQSAVKV